MLETYIGLAIPVAMLLYGLWVLTVGKWLEGRKHAHEGRRYREATEQAQRGNGYSLSHVRSQVARYKGRV